MRLLVRLRAQADAAYQQSYHAKLRGRIWRALEDTEFEDEHGDDAGLGLAMSNVFPWGDIEEGDQRSLLLASPREELLAAIAENLRDDREFNVGEMPFEVEDLSPLSVDVGEPGTRGTIETATGVLVRLYDRHREEYDIDAPDGDAPTYWRPAHSVEPFVDAVEENLQRDHDRFAPEYLPGPVERDGRLFEGRELIKTYALPLSVTTGVEIDVVLSKWRFDYRVRDDHHRRHLNLALDAGIGGRRGYGFGFLNVTEKEHPSGRTEGEGAFA